MAGRGRLRLHGHVKRGARRFVWTKLEVAKLIVQAATPVAVAVLGVYLTRLAKRFEHAQWRNQRLIEKRISVYDDLASDLNDLLCYFTYVGCWKELNPRDVVALKRRIDKKVYLAAPLFSRSFFEKCMKFLNLCYATFQGWGEDAKLRTTFNRRKETAAANWDSKWDSLFADDVPDPSEIRTAYGELMRVFSEEMGIAASYDHPLARIPANVR
jgi:hypothetical protein